MSTNQPHKIISSPAKKIILFACLSFFITCFASCRHYRTVNTSFYYWKTVYKNNKTEAAYLHHFHTSKLYVRIMDVGTDPDIPLPIPVSPIVFRDKLPDTIQIVPVVFIVNESLKTMVKPQLSDLASKLLLFVTGKVKQAGRTGFDELQIDCDWTPTTRDNYFYLLNALKHQPGFAHKTLSATLRLHQLKNQKASGIPPVNRAMLMCYNMGNLRKYGPQNSILDINELKRYAGQNLSAYPMPVDIGLPLFSWAVAFRDHDYIGLSKRINKFDLIDKNQFIFIGNNLYKAVTDLPQYGLNKADEIRWETVALTDLQQAAAYLSTLIKTDTLNVIYFHLDETFIKPYPFAALEEVNCLLR